MSLGHSHQGSKELMPWMPEVSPGQRGGLADPVAGRSRLCFGACAAKQASATPCSWPLLGRTCGVLVTTPASLASAPMSEAFELTKPTVSGLTEASYNEDRNKR